MVDRIVLYSQTKVVKQKYILCISGLVAYRQFIHIATSVHLPCVDDQGHVLQRATAVGQGARCWQDPLIGLEAAIDLGDFDSGYGVLDGDELHDVSCASSPLS